MRSTLAVLIVGSGLSALSLHVQSSPSAAAEQQAATVPDKAPAGGSDRFGDPLPAGAVGRLGTGRMRMPGERLTNFFFSANSRQLTAVGVDATIVTWDVTTGREVSRVRGEGGGLWYYTLATADGKLLASPNNRTGLPQKPWDNRNKVGLWDVATGKYLREVDHVNSRPFALSVKGDLVATIGDDYTIFISETATGRQVVALHNPGESTRIAFAPDGRTLLTGGYVRAGAQWSHRLWLWEVATGTERRQIVLEKDQLPDSVRFSPDGRTLAVLSGTKCIHLWDWVKGTELRRIAGSFSPNGDSMAFSPDGRHIAAVCADGPDGDGAVHIWEVATGREDRRFAKKPAQAVQGGIICYSPDGKLIASVEGANGFRLWDTTTGEEVCRLDGLRDLANSLAYAADGKTLMALYDDGAIRAWDTPAQKEIRQPISAGLGVVSPDGRLFVSVGGERRSKLSGSVPVVFDTATGRKLAELKEGHCALAISHNGGLIASVLPGKDFRPQAMVSGFEPPKTPDSRMPPEASGDTIVLWDAKTGTQLRQWSAGSMNKDHAVPKVHALQFSPDGKMLAAACFCIGTDPVTDTPAALVGRALDSPGVTLWEVATGKVLYQFQEAVFHGSRLRIAFAPDRPILAVAQSTPGPTLIRLLEAPSGKVVSDLRRVREARTDISGLAFSPDGKSLAAARADGCLDVWDVAGKKLQATFRTHARALAFAPDGKTLASANDDTTILIWKVEDQKKE